MLTQTSLVIVAIGSVLVLTILAVVRPTKISFKFFGFINFEAEREKDEHKEKED